MIFSFIRPRSASYVASLDEPASDEMALSPPLQGVERRAVYFVLSNDISHTSWLHGVGRAEQRGAYILIRA
jgi:hypothetical protein